jgi:hypothetical protein
MNKLGIITKLSAPKISFLTCEISSLLSDRVVIHRRKNPRDKKNRNLVIEYNLLFVIGQ